MSNICRDTVCDSGGGGEFIGFKISRLICTIKVFCFHVTVRIVTIPVYVLARFVGSV